MTVMNAVSSTNHTRGRRHRGGSSVEALDPRGLLDELQRGAAAIKAGIERQCHQQADEAAHQAPRPQHTALRSRPAATRPLRKRSEPQIAS